MSIFYSRAKLLQLLNQFIVNNEDKKFKIQRGAIENNSFN